MYIFVKNVLPSPEKNASAQEMHHAIFPADTEKVLILLKQGVNPHLYFESWTPLSAAIILGIGHTLRFKGRDKNRFLPEVLSIIRLLLEYGANSRYESSDHSAIAEVVIQSTHARDCSINFYAAILQLLTAGNGIKPHIFVSDQAKKITIGLIV